MVSTGDRLSRLEIPKLVPTKLDYTNWNAWKIEIVCALCLQQVAHYIGMDGGVFKTYENMKRPEASEQVSASIEEGDLVRRYNVQR